jgi:prepilin-type processing-associated H-X9-DG protein
MVLRALRSIWEPSSQLSLKHRLNGIREGALFPYLNSTEMYHCPGDKRIDQWCQRICRREPIKPVSGVSQLFNAGFLYGARGALNGVANETKLANIKGSKLLFVEDQYDGTFNVQGWSYTPGSQSLWDPLGNYHKGSCTFAFVDGHAENYKWRDERTMVFMSSRSQAEKTAMAEKCRLLRIMLIWIGWISITPIRPRWKGGNWPQ